MVIYTLRTEVGADSPSQSQEDPTLRHLDLGHPVSRAVRIKFSYFSYLGCGALLRQSKLIMQTNMTLSSILNTAPST